MPEVHLEALSRSIRQQRPRKTRTHVQWRCLLLLTRCDGVLEIGVHECVRDNAGKGVREFATAQVSPGKNWAASAGPQCGVVED
jgi:hypothetical protein